MGRFAHMRPVTTISRDALEFLFLALAFSGPDGATLVAWKNKDVLGWQLYDVKSQPEGQPGSATSPGNGAAGVALRDGRFLVFP